MKGMKRSEKGVTRAMMVLLEALPLFRNGTKGP